MTQTRKQALLELRDKVREGTADDFGTIKPGWPIFRGYAESAYAGSLDAAKALHEAVLPGWFPGISQNIHFGDWYAWVQTKTLHHHATYRDPARAWLLAILEALITKAGDGE
jgi:hypothetical protein